MKNVAVLLVALMAFVALSVVKADTIIGSESGSGAIDCPGTLDVSSDGTYCDGKLVSQASGSVVTEGSVGSGTTQTSSAQDGFVAVTILGTLIAVLM